MSLFGVNPNALRGALRHASGCLLGRDHVLVEAIACLSGINMQGSFLAGPSCTWTRDIWTVAASKMHFTNNIVWYRREAFKTAVKRGQDVIIVTEIPRTVLAAEQDQCYLCLRATCLLVQTTRSYFASNVVITGLISKDRSFLPIEI